MLKPLHEIQITICHCLIGACLNSRVRVSLSVLSPVWFSPCLLLFVSLRALSQSGLQLQSAIFLSEFLRAAVVCLVHKSGPPEVIGVRSAGGASEFAVLCALCSEP